MTVAARRRIIGFDRKIELAWLDATANWAAQGLTTTEIRALLDQLLLGKVAGAGPRTARDKTITVLLHIWVDVPDESRALRDDGLALLRGRSRPERLAIHWGMCLATYPYFREVAAVTGRLIGVQGKAALSQITQRMKESWGERNTVIRTTRQVVRSMVLWGVLRETPEKGVYQAAPRIRLKEDNAVGSWLMEAGITNCGGRSRSIGALKNSPEFFPYELKVAVRDLAKNPRIEIHRQDVSEDIMALKA